MKDHDDRADWVNIIDSEKNDMWWIDAGESNKVEVADIEENDVMKVGKMKFADTDAEKHDMIDVDEMKMDKTEQMYDRMNFNWIEVQAIFRG